MQRLWPAIAGWLERAGTCSDLMLLSAVAALVFLPGLGQTQYLAHREIRHAEIIREMAENRDYIVPHLLGEVYHDKPPVMHAIAAKLTQWWGKPSIFFARFPSAVAAIGVILMTYGLGRAMFDRWLGLVGALVLLSIPGLSVMARQARPDMILCFAITGCCFAMAMGMRDGRKGKRALWFAVGGIAAGLGVVTKGPYGLLFPVIFIVLSPIRRAEWRRPRLGWLGFTIALLAVASVWAIPAYLRDGGQYLHDVIFQRDLDVTERASPWYNLIAPAIFLSLPAGLFLPLAIRDWRKHGYSSPLACAASIFLIVQLVPKKRAHYLVPMYPFLALGLASTILRHAAESKRMRQAAVALIALGIAIMPLYFGIVMRWTEFPEDADLHVAREILARVKPDKQLYVATGLEESLAWIGRNGRRVVNLNTGDRDIAASLLDAPAGSYVIVTETQQEQLLAGRPKLPLKTVSAVDWPRRKLDNFLNRSKRAMRQMFVMQLGAFSTNTIAP